MTTGEAIRHFREQAGMTRYELARAMSRTTETYIWQVETGRVEPSEAMLRRLLEPLGIEYGE